MSLQAFVWAIRTLTLLALGAFGLLVSFLDPDVVGVYGDILFYILGGLLFYGLSYLGILSLYRIFLTDERAVFFLGTVARQAFLLLITAALLLSLRLYGFWYWWSILLVAAFVLLLEFTLRGIWKKAAPEEHAEKRLLRN